MTLLAIALAPAGSVVAQTQLDHPVVYQLSYDYADVPTLAPPLTVASAPQPPAPMPQQSITPSPAPDSAYAAPAACGNNACDFSACCDPRWTFMAEAMLLQRTDAGNQALYCNDFGHLGQELLNAQDLNFSVAGGPRLTAIRHGDRGWDAEIGFFQVDGFLAWDRFSGTAYMVTDSAGANFVVTDPVARYSSQLYSAEFNLRRQRNDWLTVLAGMRILELDEYYHAEGIGGHTPVPVILDTKAYNHLYGFQVGADAVLLNRGRLTITGLTKAGIYYNAARQKGREIDTGFSDLSLGAEGDSTAFLGEIGLTGVYQLTDALSFRAGYQMMWLEGVALAPEQISTTDFGGGTSSVNTDGGIFYHGAVVGMELKY
jgi:hypothetical protein